MLSKAKLEAKYIIVDSIKAQKTSTTELDVMEIMTVKGFLKVFNEIKFARITASRRAHWKNVTTGKVHHKHVEAKDAKIDRLTVSERLDAHRIIVSDKQHQKRK